MILSQQGDLNQVLKSIIVENPNKELVQAAKKANKDLRMHLYGEGLKSQISAIEGHEKEELRKLREKYSKSNKDLFARIGRPIDKVYSARGGSLYFNLSDSANKQARSLSMDVRNGLSLRKWVQTKWTPHMLDDPNGIIFMEMPAVPVDNKLTPYPTYKSITTVHDYLPSGSSLEYIVFNVNNTEKTKAGFKPEDIIYRVVDDAFDYWVKVEGETIRVLEKQTLINYFGKVPAILCSDISCPESEGKMLSLYSDVIELADDFLQTGSIRNLAKLRLAYPKYWEYADDCPTCKGEATADGKECTACKGSGKKIMINPGDVKLLMYPTGPDNPPVTPNVAGFVPFPKDYFDYSTEEVLKLENLMNMTVWGAETKQQTQGMSADKSGTAKTATEVMDDIQPKADRLFAISEMAEKREKFIIDHIIQIAIDSSYPGASVNYGRRYMLEGPDEIWERYSKARQSGAAVSILDELLMEHIETKYNGDPVSMNIQLKMLAVEPFVHLTIKEVQSLGASFEDYTNKLYFSEWYATLNEATLIARSAEDLKKMLTEYVKKKELQQPEKVVDPTLN